MPSILITHSLLTSIFIISLALTPPTLESKELLVAGEDGWALPPPPPWNHQFFNDWASRNRFQANDTLRFQYKKDSVMEVTSEEYERCESSRPMFFANNGDTIFALDQPGLYYFISGVAGHCKRGLKMVVKVLEPLSPPQQDRSWSLTSGAVSAVPGFIIPVAFLFLLIAF